MRRVLELDGLRGVAVLIVVGAHATMISMRYSLQGGNLGVDIFFVLSGFLITSLLLSEFQTTGHLDFHAFYLRRALRLLPAVTVLCLADAIYFTLKGHPVREILKAVLAVQLYVVNFAEAYGWPVSFGPLGHAWSLSIEEQFYLLWPLLLFALLRIAPNRARLAAALLGCAVFVAAWRGFLFYQTGSFNRVYHGLDTRLDALLLGCAVALWPRAVHVSKSLAGTCAVFILWQAIRPSTTINPFYGQMFAVSASVAVILLYLKTNTAAVLCVPALTWIGRVSYSLYLWHVPVLMPIRQSQLSAPMKYALYLLGSFGAAALSYYLIEQPFLRFKDLKNPRQSAIAFRH